jgi:hypothetical protein
MSGGYQGVREDYASLQADITGKPSKFLDVNIFPLDRKGEVWNLA